MASRTQGLVWRRYNACPGRHAHEPCPSMCPAPLSEHVIVCQRSGLMDVCIRLLTDGVKGWSSKRSSGPPATDVKFLGVRMGFVGFIVL